MFGVRLLFQALMYRTNRVSCHYYCREEKSLYAILEIEKDATPEQIKKAYRKVINMHVVNMLVVIVMQLGQII